MPIVKLVREYNYTRRPDMTSQYSVVKKRHTKWLCQVNETTPMSVWPMDPRNFISGLWQYEREGVETDFVAIARQKNSTQYFDQVTSHWWFFKYTEDMFREVFWEYLSAGQQLEVVRVFMKHGMRGMRPWGEDMEVLIALEQA